MSQKKDRVRLSMDIRKPDRDLLERLAKEQGVPLNEVVRRALATEAWVRSVTRNGEELLVRDTDGNLERVVFK